MGIFETPHEKTARHIGQEAEKLALCYLESQGLRLVSKNFSCKFGEIDLIMLHKECLVFVEVRYRKHGQFGTGADSVNFYKQRKILRTAEFFLQQHVNYNQHPCRIDVVSIGSGNKEINWIVNAVEA